MKSFGGYIGLEIARNKEYHENAVEVNSCRNALRYLYQITSFKKVYLPHYTCSAVIKATQDCLLDIEYYHINEQFEPTLDFSSLSFDSVLLYNNYFGLKDDYIRELASQDVNLIIDNAQAFYSKPIKGIPTIYSPRKFFGVPDGGYLYTDSSKRLILETDNSSPRMRHLLASIDSSIEDGYEMYKINEETIDNLPLKNMSKLTRALLSSIDYQHTKDVRRRNFQQLHSKLGANNKLTIDLNRQSVPLGYPYWSRNPSLKSKLISRKIYCPTLWPNVLTSCDKESFEYKLADEVAILPVDQRYGNDDMNEIIEAVTLFDTDLQQA